MKPITTLYIMIHPAPHVSSMAGHWIEKWTNHLKAPASDPQTAICIMGNSAACMPEVSAAMQELFGDRCFVDPRDWSDATKIKYTDHITQCFSTFGKTFNIYGVWTNRFALMWTEGLKIEAASRGYELPETGLQIHGFGSQWGGCMTKYVSLMSAYLGATESPAIYPELCRDAGFPMISEFVDQKLLDNHVRVFIFRTSNGLLYAQFMDTLKPVWGKPKLATIAASPSDYHFNVRRTHDRTDISPVCFGDGKATFPVMDGHSSPRITVLNSSHDDAFTENMFAGTISEANPRDYNKVAIDQLPHQQPVEIGEFH